ncbi:MAG TPA: hypothetical protein VGD71_35700, partial [Kribbella sp.]
PWWLRPVVLDEQMRPVEPGRGWFRMLAYEGKQPETMRAYAYVVLRPMVPGGAGQGDPSGVSYGSKPAGPARWRGGVIRPAPHPASSTRSPAPI